MVALEVLLLTFFCDFRRKTTDYDPKVGGNQTYLFDNNDPGKYPRPYELFLISPHEIYCSVISDLSRVYNLAIAFIEENINYYKGTFKDDINELKESFKKVELEKNKQIKRLFQIQILLWLIPIITISVLFFVNGYKYISIIILLVYSILSVFLFFWKMKIN